MQKINGRLIRNLRKQNHLSQVELAEKLFVKQSSISRWENSRGIIDDESLKAMSELFQIPEDSFYCDPSSTKAASSPTDEESHVEAFLSTDTMPNPSGCSKKRRRFLLPVSLFLNAVLLIVLVIQNVFYFPPQYSFLDRRFTYDEYHKQEVMEYSYVYWGWLTPKRLKDITNNESILWGLAPSPKENIKIEKISFYNSEEKAAAWEEPNSVAYIYNWR